MPVDSEPGRRGRPVRAAWGRRAAVVAALAAILLCTPAPARAGGVWGFSPGIKVGWTFGYGLTWGLEFSFIHLPELDLHGDIWDMTWQAFGQLITRTYGVVVNLDTFTLIADRSPNLHELGLYLKTPLLGFGNDHGPWPHDHDWDH